MGGGAWKVAYADFVTAMMALFMVLWISAQDKEILIATSKYFQNPFNSPMDATSGILPFDSDKPSSSSPGQDSGDRNGKAASSARDVDLQFLNSVAKDFFRMMRIDEDVADKPIDLQVTSDGIRVTLFDRARRPLFTDDTAEFTEWGNFVMQSLAWTIDRNRFYVVIEGHAKQGLKLTKPDYSIWDLSTDRAHAARRALTHYAVDETLIDRVTGYADTRPLPGQPPDSDGNQRVALSLSVGRPKTKEDAKAKAEAAAAEAAKQKALIPAKAHGKAPPPAAAPAAAKKSAAH